jgi:hypothetical protein
MNPTARMTIRTTTPMISGVEPLPESVLAGDAVGAADGTAAGVAAPLAAGLPADVGAGLGLAGAVASVSWV